MIANSGRTLSLPVFCFFKIVFGKPLEKVSFKDLLKECACFNKFVTSVPSAASALVPKSSVNALPILFKIPALLVEPAVAKVRAVSNICVLKLVISLKVKNSESKIDVLPSAISTFLNSFTCSPINLATPLLTAPPLLE